MKTITCQSINHSFHLLGSPMDIYSKDFADLFGSVKIVWVYIDGAWSAYSPNATITLAISQSGINTLSSIPKYYGFWIEK